MTKIGFLVSLRERLAGLPQGELEDRLSFYSEMIEDRMEDGLSEEDAVADIGSVDAIASQIVSETPLSTLVKEKIKPKRQLGGWEILLIVLLAPVWFSLIVAAVAIVLSLYASLFAVVLSLWAALVSVAACAGASGVFAILFPCLGYGMSGLACLATALALAGLTVFAFYGCRAATDFALRLTKRTALSVKLCFARGGR